MAESKSNYYFLKIMGKLSFDENKSETFDEYYLSTRVNIFDELSLRPLEGIQFLGTRENALHILLTDYNYNTELQPIEEGEISIGRMIFNCEADEFLAVTKTTVSY